MIHLALLHHPVHDKRGDLVTTAVTNIDIHDIARSCRTFGVERFWVVTPVDAMHWLVERILRHWREGWGAGYNPSRRDALETVRLARDLGEAVACASEGPLPPLVVATSARPVTAVPTRSMAESLEEADRAGRDLMLVFGTGNGLSAPVFERCDAVLPPIDAGTGYNHLSVRSAVAIYLMELAAARSRGEGTAGHAEASESH